MENTFETEVLSRLAVIESKLDGYKDLKSIAYGADTRSKQNERDIAEMKESNKWLRRLVIGESIGLVFSIILFLIKGRLGV